MPDRSAKWTGSLYHPSNQPGTSVNSSYYKTCIIGQLKARIAIPILQKRHLFRCTTNTYGGGNTDKQNLLDVTAHVKNWIFVEQCFDITETSATKHHHKENDTKERKNKRSIDVLDLECPKCFCRFFCFEI